jgi:hypothetical protein
LDEMVNSLFKEVETKKSMVQRLASRNV